MLQLRWSEGEVAAYLWVGFRRQLPSRTAAGHGQPAHLSLSWFWNWLVAGMISKIACTKWKYRREVRITYSERFN